MFQAIFELALAVIVVLSIITQLAWPMIKGTRLFPAFRKDLSLASEKIIEAEQEAEVKELETRAEEVKAATHKKTTTSKKD